MTVVIGERGLRLRTAPLAGTLRARAAGALGSRFVLAAEKHLAAGRLDRAGRDGSRARVLLEHAESTARAADARLRCLRTLGNVALRRGEFERAERLLQEAARGARLADRPLDLAQALNLFGVLYKFSGRLGDAAVAYAEAEETMRSRGVTDAVLAATLLHNRSGLAFARGDLDAADALGERSIVARVADHECDHPAVVLDRAARAAVWAEQGALEAAAEELQLALDLIDRLLGRDHYEWAVTANNLGVVEARRGDDERAERLLRDALAVKESALGASSPDVAVTLVNLYDLFARAGRADEADRMLARAEEIARRNLDAGHPVARAVCERVTRQEARPR
jgi:tetratricopeptide (TPR) repeat protein